jgi:hypothetical protein
MGAVALAAAFWPSAASAQVYNSFSVGGNQSHALLTIKADGSSSFTAVQVENRAVAEQQVRMMERFQNSSDSTDDEAVPQQPPITATNNLKPFSDEELAKKLTSRMDESEEEPDQKASVVVAKDSVTITSTRSFASLEDMLRNSYQIWDQGGAQFENARLETDTNGLLRLTLTPQKSAQRYLKSYRSAMRLSGAKSELKLVFPGKVVSSGFPEMQTNSTWIAFDATNDASMDALAKLSAAPVVVTAEPGGLKVDQPLESIKLMRTRGPQDTDASLPPIHDAGPGYVAEAQSVTTITLHVFPGGADYFEQNPAATGAVVAVKFFAPKGRTLQSVSDARVISAVDDQGRSLVATADDEEGDSSESETSGSQDVSSLSITLRLQLPAADAQSIDKISAEAVATTVGAWKEMTLAHFQADATNEIDLSTVLPGARMIITKVGGRNGQFQMQATLKGPAAVKQLDVRAKNPDSREFNSFSSVQRSSTKNGVTTRALNIQGYGFNNQQEPVTNGIVVVIRCPQDLRRERVKFELKSLDLM